MFDHSIIKKSGQWWKVMLSFVAVIGGGLLMFYGISQSSLLFPIFSGMLLGAFGFTFACIAIRCPACGARWIWLGVKGQSSNQWLVWLLSQQECPVCKNKLQQAYSADAQKGARH